MTGSGSDRPTLWRIGVSPREAALDAQGASALRDIHELGLPNVSRVATTRLFLVEGSLAEEAVERIAASLLADPITETYTIRQGGDDRSLPGAGFDAAVEVHLKGGVMDPVAGSTLAAVADLGLAVDDLAIATARLYRLTGTRSIQEAELIARRLLFNDCIEDVHLSGFGRHDPRPEHLPIAPVREFKLRHIPLRELDEEALRRLSRDAHLFLSLPEMRTLQAHYRKLDRDPTDLEIEMLAQTWSEHCVHKTLKSAVVYTGEPFPPGSGVRQAIDATGRAKVTYDNLLKDTIARATHELMTSGRVDWCLSVFEDNAGIITFDDRYAVAFKVETHNHPSAIEPYGGAATGIGGVIRDVLGCGLGAKPVANTDVFCFAPPDFPMDLLPKGILHPRRIFKGVVAGVRDYGNRMGIPTVNGAICFDDRYLGNPLVFCGCLGLIPRDRIHKAPRPGDRIVVIGGRTGRDGIHGATFSSAELTDTHADEFSHAVQIGDAITEKKVLDAMLRARDYASGCLYSAVTDCGAGGLSSAVGEMAATLGAEVELAEVPLKYAGLRYDEIWISEAQERMVLAVPPENWDTLRAICEAENVEATAIGTFRDDGRMIVRYRGTQVGDLDMHFVHEGIPKGEREAVWPAGASPSTTERRPATAENLLRDLSALNASSKEWVIRQYDHEVQGGSVIKPLVGPGQGPSDAAVIRPRLDSARGVAIANGMHGRLADVDPYWMAVAAIDEAVRNIVCVGGDPRRTAILDNFCWGNCEDPRTMGALVRACQGCYDAAIAHGTPFISGKDSLNNEFALDPADAARLAQRMPLHNNRVRIPSTLLISAIGVIDDVGRCVTMDAKRTDAGSSFYLVGLDADAWPRVELARAAALHRHVAELIAAGLVLAAHDCGEEGILMALAEMALAGRCGIDAEFGELDPLAPVVTGYILQSPADSRQLAARLEGPGITVHRIAQPACDLAFTWLCRDGQFTTDVPTLDAAWRSPLAW